MKNGNMLEKRLVRSELIQILDLNDGVKLCAHALSGARVYITDEIINLIESFRSPQLLSEWAAERTVRYGATYGQRAFSCVVGLFSEGILFDTAEGDERAYWAARFRANVAQPTIGQSIRPARRARSYEVSVPRSLQTYGAAKHHVSMLFFGACSAQLMMDFVRELAGTAMIAVDAHATTFSDVELAAELKPDIIVVGHFPEKARIFEFPSWGGSPDPIRDYVETARRFVRRVREYTAAPVLLLNLPTPSCAPLGIADGGAHVGRARKLNIELMALPAEIENVYIVDVDQALGLEGRRGLVDDAIAGFGHLGSLPWLLHQYQHPHPGFEDYSAGLGSVPDTLAHAEFETERTIASQIVSTILTLRGIGRRKCIVVDLDDTLWPGGLADNGEPFRGQPQFDIYPYGRYLGIHSALKALKARGLLLACVSKNDEEVVRKLWRYSGIPGQLFLSLDDFVTTRINWREKAENIESIARELQLSLDAFAFIDDNPVERAKIEHFLPDVMVLGHDPYFIRWTLLTHHAFQVPVITDESRRRSEMTRAQLDRDRAMASAGDPAAFLKTLNLESTVERVQSTERLARIQELIDRTHQLNTTGKKYSTDELSGLIAAQGEVYAMTAKDRFVDYGLVGACVVKGRTIEILVVSCRVLGLGLEHVFLNGVLSCLHSRYESIEALLIPNDRNLPTRKIYSAHGFRAIASDRWVLDLAHYVPREQPHVSLALRA